MPPMEPGGWHRKILTGCRNFENASSVSSARTSVTCCVIIANTISLSGHGSWVAALEMHPLDVEDRVEELREAQGIGFCNITKCCTKVCPEEIQITDNAIIPLKERLVDDYYDPLGWLWKKLRRKNERQPQIENRESKIENRESRM
jgi:hypothetical protein